MSQTLHRKNKRTHKHQNVYTSKDKQRTKQNTEIELSNQKLEWIMHANCQLYLESHLHVTA